MVQGKSFTSNTTKLLKHLDKLEIIQKGGIPSPVMIHTSICNPCNLTCSFCCFANRTMKEILPIERIKSALKQYRDLGALGIESSLRADELIPYKDKSGFLKLDTIQNIVRKKKKATSFSLDSNNKFVEDDITAYLEHPQTEPMYKVTVDGGRNITTTGSHSICFWENGVVKEKPVKEAKIGDEIVFVSKKPNVKLTEVLYCGNDKYEITPELCRLVGYFIAEGSYCFQRQKVLNATVFSFGPYEDEFEKIYIDDTISILENMGYKPKMNKLGSKTCIRLHNKVFGEFLISLGGGIGARNKRVPDFIFNVSDENKIEFLKGIYAGDGNFRSTTSHGKYNRNVLCYKTSSKIMTQTLSYLLDSLDINCTILEGMNKERILEGRTLAPSNYYSITVGYKPHLEKLVDVVTFCGGALKYKDSPFSHSKPHLYKNKINEDCYSLKVKKIEKLDNVDELVYDISVGKTHKFVSSFNSFVHNSGGGESTLHPQFDEFIKYAHELGYAIGICTNGTTLTKWKHLWKYFTYVRLGMYGFDEGYEYDLSALSDTKANITAAYVWDINIETSTNPNITGNWVDKKGRRISPARQKEENFYKMLEWVETNKIPTRIAFNAIKPQEEVLKDIEQIRSLIKDKDLKYAFLSDFNYEPYRRNDHCYMHMVKPFVFTDGNVYVCPSSELSVENSYNMNPEFKICDIEGITDYYKSLEGGADISRRHHACKFCKYALQNHLVDDIVLKTENNEFA